MGDFALHKRKTFPYLPRNGLDSTSNRKISVYLTFVGYLITTRDLISEPKRNSPKSYGEFYFYILKKGELLFLIVVLYVCIPGIELGQKVKEWHQTHKEAE